MTMEKLALVFTGMSILPLILTETHWMVTENGRIHSVSDSLYNMARPHDLVQFLKQEERVKRSDDAKNRLTSQKTVIRHHEQKDDPQIESRLMQSDPDCILAGKPLAQQDLFLSTIVPLEYFDIRLDIRFGQVSKTSKAGAALICTSHALPFSMAAFEHLEGVRDRHNLSSAPEPGLSQITFDAWVNMTDFAEFLATVMQQRADDWLVYTLASYYFRFVGDGMEAIECLRRALHFAPRELAVIPMLSLGNVLHQSSRSKDGAVVMDTAIAFNDSTPQVYFTAGHVYAVSLQYEKAIDAFERAFHLDETLAVAKQQQAAVRCHQKLESALETQHQNLQTTLSELQSYQVRLKNFQTLHEEMLCHVVDSEQRQLSALTYDHVTYGPLEGLNCNTTMSNGQTFIDCDIVDFVAYKSAKQEAVDGTSASKATKPIETKSDTKTDASRPPSPTKTVANSPFPHSTATTSTTVDVSEETRYLESLEVYRNLELSKPTKQKRYASTSSRDAFPQHQDRLPAQEDCTRSEPLNRPAAAPFLFLSPENKGFEVKQLLTEYLNLNETFAHPLPWYPPFCSPHVQDKSELHLDCCDHLLGVQRAKVRERERLLPEPSLKQVISSFAPGPLNSDAEIGQRILTLMKYNILAKWLVYNLAALYWRLMGVTAEAAACLRLALADESGRMYADVALFQLSYLAYNAGNRVDDAINLLHQALDVDYDEPAVHSMLSHYLIVKENFTGAAFHLRRALELEPTLPGGPEMMKSLLCKVKNQQQNSARVVKPSLERPPLSTCSENTKGPKFFCLREGGEEKCYLEERMLPGAQDAMSMCPACSMPHCLKPPPLASMFISMVDKTSKPARDVISKPKGGVKIQPVIQPEQEEIDGELSLIDASMQPGTSFVKDAARVERKQPPSSMADPVDKLSPPPANNNNKGDEKAQATASNQVIPPTKTKTGAAFFAELDSTMPDFIPTSSRDMVKAGTSLVVLPTTTAECVFWKSKVKLDQPISTYLSGSAKGIDAQNYIDFTSPIPAKQQLEPICPAGMPSTMWTMDHLLGYVLRHNITDYKPESGLKEAFQKLGGTKEPIENVATRLAYAMRSDSGDRKQKWVLTTLAALYWRIQGNASMAVDCLRHAINEAPYPMKDLALISLANVYHQSGFLHSALVTAGAAMHVSPNFVVVHFTLANIHAALGDWDRAMMFYFSSLSLQGSLEAAKDRIRAIYCSTGSLPKVFQ